MGFKIKVPKAISNIAKNVAGSTVLGAQGLLANKMLNGGNEEAVPGEDPQVTALRRKMSDEAKQYREQLPGLQNEQEQILKRDAAGAVDTGIRGTRKNYNDRGLLYSGMRVGAEGDVRNRVAAQLAGSLGESKSNFERMASDKENAAANVGLAGYQDSLNRMRETERLNQESLTMRRQALQQLGSAAGYGAGALYKPNTASAQTSYGAYDQTPTSYNQGLMRNYGTYT